MAEFADYSPDGNKIAYNPRRTGQTSWRGYRGGQMPPVWLLDLNDNSYIEIPAGNSSNTHPVWIGDYIYFLSDRNRTMNLFCYNVNNKELKQLAKNGDFDIKYLSADSKRLIYESNGYLYVFDPTTSSPKMLDINISADYLNIRANYKNVSGEISNFNLSPTGVRAVFEAHEINTFLYNGGNDSHDRDAKQTRDDSEL